MLRYEKGNGAQLFRLEGKGNCYSSVWRGKAEGLTNETGLANRGQEGREPAVNSALRSFTLVTCERKGCHTSPSTLQVVLESGAKTELAVPTQSKCSRKLINK